MITQSGLLKFVRRALAEPRLAGVDLNSDRRIAVHLDILQKKFMLHGVFADFYHGCRRADEHFLSGPGKRIEIGSGTGLFKSFYPDVLLSDIVPAPHLDIVLDAENMRLPDSSVRAFYVINTFHHFANPDRFFRELLRVLAPGGGCVLVEPYYGPGATFFFSRVFTSEGFDKTQQSWTTARADSDVMTNANQAMSYIIFRRDAEMFRAQFPGLEVVHSRRFHNYLRYFFSGGLNFRRLLPDFATPLLRGFEFLLAPADHLWALHYLTVLRKT